MFLIALSGLLPLAVYAGTKCPYYPSFAAATDIYATYCYDYCCAGTPTTADQACCGSDYVWWIALVVTAVVILILCGIGLFLIYRAKRAIIHPNSDSEANKNEEHDAHNTLPQRIPRRLAPIQQKQAKTHYFNPKKGYNSVMNQISTFLHHDSTQKLNTYGSISFTEKSKALEPLQENDILEPTRCSSAPIKPNPNNTSTPDESQTQPQKESHIEPPPPPPPLPQQSQTKQQAPAPPPPTEPKPAF